MTPSVRLALRTVALQFRRSGSWLALGLLAAGPAIASAAIELTSTPWGGSFQRPAANSIGALYGLYLGLNWLSNDAFGARLARSALLLHRFGVLFLCIGIHALAGAVGEGAVQPWGQALALDVPWRAAVLAAIGTLALARLPGPGLALLASLAAGGPAGQLAGGCAQSTP